MTRARRNFASTATQTTRPGAAATPDLFKQQLPLIREVLASLRIPMVELEGYEADDLLATLTKHAREEGCDVTSSPATAISFNWFVTASPSS